MSPVGQMFVCLVFLWGLLVTTRKVKHVHRHTLTNTNRVIEKPQHDFCELTLSQSTSLPVWRSKSYLAFMLTSEQNVHLQKMTSHLENERLSDASLSLKKNGFEDQRVTLSFTPSSAPTHPLHFNQDSHLKQTGVSLYRNTFTNIFILGTSFESISISHFLSDQNQMKLYLSHAS